MKLMLIFLTIESCLIAGSFQATMVGSGELPCTTTIERFDDRCEVKSIEPSVYVFVRKLQMVMEFENMWDSGIDLMTRSLNVLAYLNGNNERAQVIPMGGVVSLLLLKTDAQGNGLMGSRLEMTDSASTALKFYVPKAFAASVPKPSDPIVQVASEKVTVASIKFGGYPTLLDIFSQREALLAKLGSRAADYELSFMQVSTFTPIWQFWDQRHELYLFKSGFQLNALS